MFGQALATIVWRSGLHLTDFLIEAIRTDSGALKLFSRYGVGVLGNMPTFDLFLRYVGVEKRERKLALIAYVLSFVFLGIGIIVARAVRHIGHAPE